MDETIKDVIDARRQGPINVKWDGMTGTIGRLYIDDEFWGAVEWSEKRKAWCIEDAEGRCLAHKESIHGKAPTKEEAVALAEQMIRDGRMPTPEDAEKAYKEVQAKKRKQRENQPSYKRRLAEKQESDRLYRIHSDAEWREREQPPFWEMMAEAFDFADPEIWKSNSFAMMRQRLIISVKDTIAKLEYHHDVLLGRTKSQKRLERARKLLALLDPDGLDRPETRWARAAE
jgi:hypothetical protein